jgi:hypothetical protein
MKMSDIEEKQAIPTLIDLCIEILLNNTESKSVDKVLDIYARVDLHREGMETLRQHIIKKIHSFFPLLLKKFPEDELKSFFDPDDWSVIHGTYFSLQKAKAEFSYLKGTVLDRTSVAHIENSDFYPLEALLHGVAWPRNVKSDSREQFLSSGDFHIVFGMSKEEFVALPSHMKIRMKKEKQLF